MLTLPGKLTADTFLERYWQKQPLFMPRALPRIRPAITRNELGWLATLEDVESRLVFVDRSTHKRRYRVESGPFEPAHLQNLPKRDWTLLVHDVEKHLPAMRALFHHVPFIPQWRIDDLMVSFAAPGGGVGPHRDNYDVFLCQGTGVRNWRFTTDAITDDLEASDDLALLSEFESAADHDTNEGDVLYLPPGAAHWGTAKRACMTYSIGMRAPQVSDLSLAAGHVKDGQQFYGDADLTADESVPGYISHRAAKRALKLLGLSSDRHNEAAKALGLFATQPKDWLKPDGLDETMAMDAMHRLQSGARLEVHGMALIAFDSERVYVNGSTRLLAPEDVPVVEEICTKRSLSSPASIVKPATDMLQWMLRQGAFEIPENS
ncbi:MAG: hypothetical protein OEW73_07815 [Gammaproteobacteria bacterium]|nr:hypothetical protein [Gammaproteobacteria bacterium]MDH5261232.1 hypothetical protein [Gammaproteobacteria bacterium]MDH5584182.1 hypothetical protein [Gammaproteobacteria bacterium]